MSELREPSFVFLLRNQGKKSNKVEVFDATLWEDCKGFYCNWKSKRYRLRINGKWLDKKNGVNNKYYTKTEIRDMLWRSIHF